VVYLPSNLAQLLADSPYHCDISEDGVRRLIEAPIRFGKAIIVKDGDDVVGFSTYAFLYEHQVEGYLNKTRKLKSIDFMREKGELWFIDFIAPYGNAREVLKEVKTEFGRRYPQIYSAKMFRRAKGYDARVFRRAQ